MSKQSYFSLTDLIQTIQFSIRIISVCIQLYVKTDLIETIQFGISTVSMSKTVPFQTNLFGIPNSSISSSSVWHSVRILVLLDS